MVSTVAYTGKKLEVNEKKFKSTKKILEKESRL